MTIKARAVDIELDRPRPISFPLKAIEELVETLPDKDIKNLQISSIGELRPLLMKMLLYADPECELTSDDLGELIDGDNLPEIVAAVTLILGSPIPEETKKLLADRGKEIPKMYRPT